MGHTKVTNLDNAFLVKEKIFKFDISVNDVVAMTVGQTFGNLLEQEL